MTTDYKTSEDILTAHFKTGGLVRHGLRSSLRPKLHKDQQERTEESRLRESERQTRRVCQLLHLDSEMHQQMMMEMQMAHQPPQAFFQSQRPKTILQKLKKVILPKELFYLMCRE